MAIYRIHKTEDYTVMSNWHLRDKSLSLKAKGLLSMMFSLPNKWNYSIKGLVAICKENETAVKSTLKELKDNGYLVVTKRMPNATESGRIEYEYDIYETPQAARNQGTEHEGIEKQGVENLSVENQPQLNKDELSTKELSTKELNNNNTKAKKTAVDFSAIMDERQITDPALRNAINEFIEDRKDRKKPFTERGFTQFLNELNKLEPTSINRQVAMIKNAILHSWLTVYPIKPANNSYSKQDDYEYCKRAPEDEINLDDIL